MNAVILFELRYRSRQATPYIFFLLLATFGFLMYSSEGNPLTSGAGVRANAPSIVAELGCLVSLFGAVMVTALMGTTIHRDFEHRTHEMFFTTGLMKRDYMLGRFLASFAVTLVVFAAPFLAMPLGAAMPWVDHLRFLPFQPAPFITSYLYIVAPNLFLLGSLFFVVGALTRRLSTIYVTAILLYVCYAFATAGLTELENRDIAAILDPFGMRALTEMTQYWSVAENNHNLIQLTGLLLWNRVVWSGIAAVLLAVGYYLFSFSAQPRQMVRWKWRWRAKAPAENSSAEFHTMPSVSHPVSMRFDNLKTLWRLSGFYLIQIVRSVTFRLIALISMIALVAIIWSPQEVLETPVRPVTRIVVTEAAEFFAVIYLILITFYVGELAWRERILRLDQICDALPINSEITYIAKVVAVATLIAILNLTLIVAGVATQAFKGYFHFEFGLYFGYLYGIVLPEYIGITLFAFFVHSVVNHKFVGHAIVIAFYLVVILLHFLGVEHFMLLPMTLPSVHLSDMNGYGPFLQPFIACAVYWLSFGVLLSIAALRIWPRGTETGLRARLRAGTFTRGMKTALLAAGSIQLISGMYILFNTLALNPYRTHESKLQMQSHYERDYRPRYVHMPQPRVTGVKVWIDLHPERRQYFVRADLVLKNRSYEPISELAIDVDADLTIRAMTLDRSYVRSVADREVGFYAFRLASPLLPDQEMRLHYEAAFDRTGFRNGEPNTTIVGNGTFLASFLPHIGYQPDNEVAEAGERRRRGLSKRSVMAPYTDLAARQNTYIGNDADWIDYEATIRTAPDQIAVTPGYLDREWVEDGRRCFHYKMDAPIRYFVCVVSAKYRLRMDQWSGPDGRKASVEIFYHPGHEFNVERMVKGVNASLSYCSQFYSSYQFRQMRIIEFPDYAKYAESFANTVPYSEGIGFIAQASNPGAQSEESIDYPFYVTAHEVAHQWWAHQVLGANVEGAEMLSESLAEYTALMVMDRTYGHEIMRKLLRLDMDGYLKGRGEESEGENPLARVRHQPYIQYQKGALVFYALRERIGEKRLNAILAQFIRDRSFQHAPYSTGEELVERIRRAVPADVRDFVTDQFEKITIYGNRADSATWKRADMPNGRKRWRVTLKTTSEKYYSNAYGDRTTAPLDDWIEVGVFAQGRLGSKVPGRTLALRMVHVKAVYGKYIFYVDQEPGMAGIDPNFHRIDLYPDYHLVPVLPEPSSQPPPARTRLFCIVEARSPRYLPI